MIGSERPPKDGQGPFQRTHGFLTASHRPVQHREVVEHETDLRMDRSAALANASAASAAESGQSLTVRVAARDYANLRRTRSPPRNLSQRLGGDAKGVAI